MTPEEIIEAIEQALEKRFYSGNRRLFLNIITGYGRQEFERAIDLAAENAKVILDPDELLNSMPYEQVNSIVDKESITKLKLKEI